MVKGNNEQQEIVIIVKSAFDLQTEALGVLYLPGIRIGHRHRIRP